MTLNVVVPQVDFVDGETDDNLARFDALTADTQPGRLWVLPELWSSGYVHADWPRIAQAESPRVLAGLRRLCAERRIHVAGSMIECSHDDRLVNRFRLIDDAGRDALIYDKVHLFPGMSEPDHLAGGTRSPTCSDLGITAHASLCFDLRFPTMYRRAARAGAGLFIVSSAWPLERIDTMVRLAWARAVENQAFIVVSNRYGRASDGTVFGGHSLIVGPDGTVLGELANDEGTLSAEIHANSLAIRDTFPVLTLDVEGIDT